MRGSDRLWGEDRKNLVVEMSLQPFRLGVGQLFAIQNADIRLGQLVLQLTPDFLLPAHQPVGGFCDRRQLLCRRHKSEEHTSELQSLMRISYAVFCLNKKTINSSTFT